MIGHEARDLTLEQTRISYAYCSVKCTASLLPAVSQGRSTKEVLHGLTYFKNIIV